VLSRNAEQQILRFAHDDKQRANVPTQCLTKHEATPCDVKRRTQSRSPMPHRYPLPRSLWRLKIRGFWSPKSSRQTH